MKNHMTKILAVVAVVAIAIGVLRLFEGVKSRGDHPKSGEILCSMEGKAYKSSADFFALVPYRPVRDAGSDGKCAVLTKSQS